MFSRPQDVCDSDELRRLCYTLLGDIVRTFVSDRAQILLHEAEQAIKHLCCANHLLVSLPGDLAQALYRIGSVQPALKFWDEAIEVAQESIRSYHEGGVPDVDTWKSLSIIAKDLSSIGQNERAERAVTLIDNDNWRERTRQRM